MYLPTLIHLMALFSQLLTPNPRLYRGYFPAQMGHILHLLQQLGPANPSETVFWGPHRQTSNIFKTLPPT